MYVQRDSGGRGLGSTGLGLCVVPKQVTITKLVCTDADLEAIGREMGKGRGLVIREVRTALEDAVRRALVLIERAESQLKIPRATGQGGVAMRQRFQDAFGTSPEFIPTWRKAGESWDMGAVVRERLRCAAKIMATGGIEFVAWGPNSCPFAFDWTTRPWAVVIGGVPRICLGQTFWQAAGRADAEGLATTLLHECLHIYFNTITHHRERWAYNVATCYERYVLLCNGIPIPGAVNTPCPSKARVVAGVDGLGQPQPQSDADRSIDAITKALQINPNDGYIKGSPARGKLHIAFLSVPLPAALELHSQLSSGSTPLGRLFRYRLHRATRKTYLDMLWRKHLAHNVRVACDNARAVLASEQQRLGRMQRDADTVCQKSGEDSTLCHQARQLVLTGKTRLESLRNQPGCP